MLDWLFGKSRKDNLTQYDNAREDARINQKVNDFYKSQLQDIYNDPNNAALLNSMRSANPTFDDSWNNNMKALDIQSGKYGDAYKQADEEYNKADKKQRNNYFGDGLLGAVLNPVAQTATAIGDLVTGNYKNRDAASDIGAAVETGLGLLPFGAGLVSKIGGASKLGKAGAAVKKAADSIPGMALTGAGMGGAEAFREGGEDTKLDDVLGRAGSGALFGAAFPAAQKMISNRIGDGGFSLKSMMPQTKAGKLALGGGALLGGAKLMGAFGDGQPDQEQSLIDRFREEYGRDPSYEELNRMKG
jgi:hypothetical protein